LGKPRGGAVNMACARPAAVGGALRLRLAAGASWIEVGGKSGAIKTIL